MGIEPQDVRKVAEKGCRFVTRKAASVYPASFVFREIELAAAIDAKAVEGDNNKVGYYQVEGEYFRLGEFADDIMFWLEQDGLVISRRNALKELKVALSRKGAALFGLKFLEPGSLQNDE